MRIRRSRCISCAAFLIVVLAAGCGGDEEPDPGGTQTKREAQSAPRPAESPRAAANAIAAAARRSDCGALVKRMHGLARRAQCQALRRSGELEAIGKLDGSPGAYGTAAVAEVNSPKSTMFVVLALDVDSRFKLLTLLSPIGPPMADAQAKPVVEHGIDALRRGDCNAFKESFLLHDRKQTADEVCALPGVRELRRTLRGRRSPRLDRLGGNSFVALYGVAFDSGEFFTVALTSSELGYLWADLARAR